MLMYVEALEQALESVDQQPPDAAAARLARGYAAQLDAGGDLTKLGPQLLQVLTALGMTPAARAAAVTAKGDDSDSRPLASSSLDELRSRRATRQH